MIGILFDLDGVLIDSSSYHFQAWKKLENEVPDFKMANYQQFLETFGETNDSVLIKHLPHSTFEERFRFGERKEEFFREICGESLPWIPGIEKFLQEVEKRGIPKIIASSTTHSNLSFFLKKTELGRYFNNFVCAQEVSQGKPAPDIFLKAAEKINLPAQSCLVLEDSPAGLVAGTRAGCFVVALATTHQAKDLHSYHQIFPSARELNLDEMIGKKGEFVAKNR